MLWRVHGTDKYFLSSLHFLPEEDSGLDPRIWHLLPQMSRVVFESDYSRSTLPEYVMYQNGRQLHEVVPADVYDACAKQGRS